MSDVEGPGRDVPRQAETWGSASDNGHVYQSRGSQFISYVHVYGGAGASEGAMARAGTHERALEHTQERVDLLIRALSLTQADWQARCAELEEKARRAEAEGRAQALAEAQEQLMAAELRVMKAKQMMGEAQRERQRTEALLTQAQQELALRRRAEERRDEEEARRREAPRVADESESMAHLNEEGEQFTDFLERAQAELGAVRDDLRWLSEGATTQNRGNPADRVIEGQWSRHSAPDESPARAVPHSVQGNGVVAQPPPFPPASGYEWRGTPTPARPRRSWGDVTTDAMYYGLHVIPPWIPMLVVTSIRAAFASDASLWKAVPFTIGAVVVGVPAWLFFSLPAALPFLQLLVRGRSEIATDYFKGTILVVASLVPLVASFWTPLTWPGPLGAWGRGLASAFGVG